MAIITISRVKGYPYDFMTIKKFASETELSDPTVYGLMREEDGEESTLDVCYPMPDSEDPADAHTGPKCIVMNSKAMDYMKKRRDKLRKKKAKK